MRSRIVVIAAVLVLLVPASLFALLVVRENAMFHPRLPTDTLATNESQAEDVAYTVASNAGCGAFYTEYAIQDPWMFECMIGQSLYQIFIYGSDQSRSADLARLQGDGRPYVAKAYYAVTAPKGGVDKFAAMVATPPPASIMDPFR
jgi:hypothetical protein